ncbi:hypothetical protein CDAR_468851 [Caerostris darwini]|uniref:Uncharacterized protein n=1 Tax=Caerostris darwini TaxID=1538125 RepID=A0AAV4R0Y9_9ARAC|nr:hypothetical protein CDAR_468851 [Caerostris darwini]
MSFRFQTSTMLVNKVKGCTNGEHYQSLLTNNSSILINTCVQQHSSRSEPVSKTASQTGWPFECPTEPNAPIVGGPHRISARDTKQTTITQPSKAEATSPKIPHSPKRGPLQSQTFRNATFPTKTREMTRAPWCISTPPPTHTRWSISIQVEMKVSQPTLFPGPERGIFSQVVSPRLPQS